MSVKESGRSGELLHPSWALATCQYPDTELCQNLHSALGGKDAKGATTHHQGKGGRDVSVRGWEWARPIAWDPEV